jgi:hypothetical protein
MKSLVKTTKRTEECLKETEFEDGRGRFLVIHHEAGLARRRVVEPLVEPFHEIWPKNGMLQYT